SANVQNSYNQSIRLAAMAEDARAIFALLTRDLRLAVTRADDTPGNSIRIHQPDKSQIWFVTANEAGSGEGSSLVEVAYRWIEEDAELQRAEIDDRAPFWNPYGDRKDIGALDLSSLTEKEKKAEEDEKTIYGYQTVADRVVGFSLVCYDSRCMVSAETLNQSTQSPAMVAVTLALLDSKSFLQWQRLTTEDDRKDYVKQRARVFQKMIQIPTLQFTSE
ncbi:MAG: hypothetical protein RBU25_09940, partial [Lentisphaeria bacterium]|nr:hypothetical protein [Lentisphaeria bacterium]